MAKSPNLIEFDFACKVAGGMTQRDAYCKAFGVIPTTKAETASVDQKASRLVKRPDIARLIEEESKYQQAHISSQDREVNQRIKEGLQQAILSKILTGEVLEREPLKGIELLSRLTGAFAPEEHTVRNGGATSDYNPIPRGVAGLDENTLDGVLLEHIGREAAKEGEVK